MKKYYYFYDLNEVLIDRYPAEIATKLSSINDTQNFVFIYSEKYNNTIPKKIPRESKCFYIKSLSPKILDELVLKYPPNSLTTIAQRIPDMWMLSYFNHLEVPTFIVQHGLWSDRLQRINFFSLIMGKFSKFLSYIQYTKFICKFNKSPLLPTLHELYRFLLAENTNISATKYLSNKNLKATTAFVFDKSWDEYYVHKYNYKIGSLIYIGNPDFLTIKGRDTNKQEDAVCYLCQSLVEDGRLKLKEFEEFLTILNEYIPEETKLYIKMHPRSKKEYYDVLLQRKNTFFVSDFKICKYYIAHYTGLLATARQCSKNILIWELNDHYMPKYFYQFASNITSNGDDVCAFICDKLDHNNTQSSKLFSEDDLMNFDPICTIAKNIIRNINSTDLVNR